MDVKDNELYARLYSPPSKEDIKKRSEQVLQEYIEECTKTGVCVFNMDEYLRRCYAASCSDDDLKKRIINHARSELYELTKKGTVVLLNEKIQHTILYKQIGEYKEVKQVNKEKIDIEIQKQLFLHVAYSSKHKYVFEIEECIHKTYRNSDTGQKTGEDKFPPKKIRVFEISDMWEEYDVFTGKSKFIFSNIRYYVGNRGANEKQVMTDTIHEVINYISSDAVKRIKEFDYDIADDIINVVKLICQHRRKYKTSVYGIIDIDKQYLPGQYEIIAAEKDEKIKSYESMFCEEPKWELLPSIAKNLIEYTREDYISKIILQYSVASIFRYYLLNTKRIDMFPNLIVIGEKGQGKSARINLLFNQFLMGTVDFYTKDFLYGSGIRLESEGWTTMPMFIDELSEIPANKYDILKAIATAPKATIAKYTAKQERKSYTLLRPLIIATNKVIISDDAFEDRCIVISVAEGKEFDVKEKTYAELRDSIEHLGRAVYLKINDMLDIIDEISLSPKRSTAKQEIIRLGGELIRRILKEEFGLDYEPVELQTGEAYTIDTKDLLEEHIISTVRKLIKEIAPSLSLPDLMDCDDGADEKQDIIMETKTKLAKMGLYVRYSAKEGQHYIGISKEGMKYLDLRTKFKIKSMRQLASELGMPLSTVLDEYTTVKVVKIYLD